ncbi:hypothetical protein GGX14DRAFT_695642 [Mycena pura]|uniref:Uncharacterized protein n=1 Tax=Mycena pura TaxID=153505 RepID=A0AAD6YKF2_9AGAR|nr:hypothetical protein GGX14DRAFT_695642 [Mycena pura]
MSQPSLAAVNYIGLILMTMFYGIYFVLFVISMYLLLRQGSINKVRGQASYVPILRSMVFISGVALFIAVTTDWAATVFRNAQALVYLNNSYLTSNDQPSAIVGGAFLSLSLVLGDAMIHFLAVVVESAALYTAWVIYYTITHELGLNIQYIAISTFPTVVGIANALIHVRIAMGNTIEQRPGTGAVSAIHFNQPPSRVRTGASSQAGDSITLESMATLVKEDANTPAALLYLGLLGARMSQPSLAAVNYIGLILMTMFYGIYCVLFVLSMYLLLWQGSINKVRGQASYGPILRSMVFISGVALFIVVTGDWVETVFRNAQALVYLKDSYFTSNDQPSAIAGGAFLALSLILGDAMIHFLAVVVESAALYTAWVIYYTITHELGLDIQYIAISTFPTVVGIANALIHVRIAMGKTIEQRHGTGPASASAIRFYQPPSRVRTGASSDSSQARDSITLENMTTLVKEDASMGKVMSVV